MIHLAVDYGDARTGLAVCDEGEHLASPLCVVAERDPDRLAGRIAAEATARGAAALVVGLPRNMDGSYGFRADACRAFAVKLEQATGLPVTLWDERCSTQAAYRALDAGAVYGKKRKAVVDAVAAVMILESYLTYRRHQTAKEIPAT